MSRDPRIGMRFHRYLFDSERRFPEATGNPGVHIFTLDPGIGEFLLSKPDVRIPEKGIYYGANEAAIRHGGGAVEALSDKDLRAPGRKP